MDRIAMGRIAHEVSMNQKHLPNRHKHRTLPVLSFAEQYGVRCFDLLPPVKDTDDMEAETTEHQN